MGSVELKTLGVSFSQTDVFKKVEGNCVLSCSDPNKKCGRCEKAKEDHQKIAKLCGDIDEGNARPSESEKVTRCEIKAEDGTRTGIILGNEKGKVLLLIIPDERAEAPYYPER